MGRFLESFKFHTMVQSDGQPFDSYLAEMKSQAVKCEFVCGNCRASYMERMLMDKLILYCRDQDVQAQLLANPNLTLALAENTCRSVEMSRHLVSQIKSKEVVDGSVFKVPTVPVLDLTIPPAPPPPSGKALRKVAKQMQQIAAARSMAAAVDSLAVASSLVSASSSVTDRFEPYSLDGVEYSGYGQSSVGAEVKNVNIDKERTSTHSSDQRRNERHYEESRRTFSSAVKTSMDRMSPSGVSGRPDFSSGSGSTNYERKFQNSTELSDPGHSRFEDFHFKPIEPPKDTKPSYRQYSERYANNQGIRKGQRSPEFERKYREYPFDRRDDQKCYEREDRRSTNQSRRQDGSVEGDSYQSSSRGQRDTYGPWTMVESNGDDMLKPSPSKVRRTPQKEPSVKMSPMAHEILTRKRVRDMLTPTPSKDNGKIREKREAETDPEVIARRQKQIDYGKNTLGYERYRELVPKEQRSKIHPKTPPIGIKFSRRAWDGLIRVWRQRLHFWDSPAEGGGNPECLEIASDMSDCSSIDGSLPNTPVQEVKRIKNERTSRFTSSRFPSRSDRDFNDDDSGCTPLPD